jgi:hypothetical protein
MKQTDMALTTVRGAIKRTLDDIFRTSKGFYSDIPVTDPFQRLVAILAHGQGSEMGRKNYLNLLQKVNNIGIESSEQIRQSRPLGFSLEGVGMGISVMVHLLLFALFMILLFFFVNIPMLYRTQVFLSKDMVGSLVAQHIDPITTPISPTSLQSLLVRGELDRYYNEIDANSGGAFEQNHRECMLNALYMVVAILAVFVALYIVSRYKYNKIDWGRMLFYIIAVLVLFGAFEFILFMTIITKYNPLPEVESQLLFLKSLEKKLNTPLHALYDTQEEYEADNKIYRSPILCDVVHAIMTTDA